MKRFFLNTAIILIVGMLVACDGKKGQQIRPIFASKAVLLIGQREASSRWGESAGQMPDVLFTIAELIRNRTVLERVVESLDLQNYTDFMEKKADSTPYTKDEALIRLSNCLRIALRPKTRFVDIRAEHTNPEVARILADAATKEFLRSVFEQRLAYSRKANQLLLDEAAKLRDRVKECEKALQNYREMNRTESNEYNVIKKDLEISNSLYQAVLGRIKEIDVVPGNKPDQQIDWEWPIKLMEEATTPLAPEKRQLNLQQ